MTDTSHCGTCRDTGFVCEDHPGRTWGDMCCDDPVTDGLICGHGACHCGAAGMPCPACCSPVPEDGTVPIGWAFTPDRLRGPLNAALAARARR